jgi:hypothetical protein
MVGTKVEVGVVVVVAVAGGSVLMSRVTVVHAKPADSKEIPSRTNFLRRDIGIILGDGQLDGVLLPPS